MKYRVLQITKNLEKYPDARQDTINHPNLQEHLIDDFQIFIMDEEGKCYDADDFFHLVGIKVFETKDEETKIILAK